MTTFAALIDALPTALAPTSGAARDNAAARLGEIVRQLPLAIAGCTPVSLIAGSAFGLDLRVLALVILAPIVAGLLARMLTDAATRRLVARAVGAGVVATALYDLCRGGFLWSGLMDHDPIPHIGTALGLDPAWAAGYTWRYLGNGTGLALTFLALGLRGTRVGLLYGLAVCSGLLLTLLISPLGTTILFPLSVTSVIMMTLGHAIYGAVLGTIAARLHDRDARRAAPPAGIPAQPHAGRRAVGTLLPSARRPLPGSAVALGLLIVCLGPAAAVAAAGTPDIDSWGYTGEPQTWTVPAHVTSATIRVSGAQGGDGTLQPGGLGGEALATVPVIPGEVLQVDVGGAGRQGPLRDPRAIFAAAGGFNGGGNGGIGGVDSFGGSGGGGASDVRRTSALSSRLVIGGGGGGGGGGGQHGPGGSGGIGASLAGNGAGTLVTGFGATGGSGGGQIQGGSGGRSYAKLPVLTGGIGTAGNFGLGGTGGYGSYFGGSAGGGGGGGWFGGGAGGGGIGGVYGVGASGGGGGGGGSSYGPASTQYRNGIRAGNGRVIITWVQPDLPTTTVIRSSGSPSVYGDPVRFTAVVSPADSRDYPATGTVQFEVDGAPLGGPATLSRGHADSVAALRLASGPHTVRAVYRPTGLFTGSTSTFTQVVGAEPSATTVTSSSPHTSFGEPVRFTATVEPPSATGSVRFAVDGSDLGGPVTLVNGSATSQEISRLAAGPGHSVTAVYSGDATVSASTGTLTQSVSRSATTTVIGSTALPSAAGEEVAFTASVAAAAPGAGMPTGHVRFIVDGSDLGGPVDLVDGSATSAGTSSLSLGSHRVTAVYDGDASFVGSGAELSQVVLNATTTTLTSSANPSVAGTPVTFTATVASVIPGAGTPTGTVQFRFEGDLLGDPVALVGGVATTPVISDLGVGSRRISADYNGDNRFAGSHGELTQTVDP